MTRVFNAADGLREMVETTTVTTSGTATTIPVTLRFETPLVENVVSVVFGNVTPAANAPVGHFGVKITNNSVGMTITVATTGTTVTASVYAVGL